MMRVGLVALSMSALGCVSAPAENSAVATSASAAPEEKALPVSAPPAVPKITAPSDLTSEEAVARQASFTEAMDDVAERQKVFDDKPARFSLAGSYAQGGLLFGQTDSDANVRLDGEPVMVGDDGRFVIGFGRDSALSSLLLVTYADGAVERHAIEIEDREFPVQRIDGLDQSKVSGYTKEQLAKIGLDTEKKKAARQKSQQTADWAAGFDWPIKGRISGVFGSQRILNGEPKRPHSGLDIAAPQGTPVRAPAAGIVTLSEEGMYFEGGLILIDHGHWVESAFLHLSRLDVEPGQRVEKGDVIGAVGATGRATGPHLHWSMKWVGRQVDPQLTLEEEPDEG